MRHDETPETRCCETKDFVVAAVSDISSFRKKKNSNIRLSAPVVDDTNCSLELIYMFLLLTSVYILV